MTSDAATVVDYSKLPTCMLQAALDVQAAALKSAEDRRRAINLQWEQETMNIQSIRLNMATLSQEKAFREAPSLTEEQEKRRYDRVMVAVRDRLQTFERQAGRAVSSFPPSALLTMGFDARYRYWRRSYPLMEYDSEMATAIATDLGGQVGT